MLEWFWLAEKLGKSVAWCLENISSREFTQWKVYEEFKRGIVKPASEKKMTAEQMQAMFRVAFNGNRNKLKFHGNG